VNVLYYGFEKKAEIGHFRMYDPMRVMREQGLAETRSTENERFPVLEASPEFNQEQLLAAHEKTSEDVHWADVLFTQRYVKSADARQLGPMVEGQQLPWVLDIDDHILDLDADKSVFGQYAAPHPSAWGETRPVTDPSEVGDGEILMRHATGEMLAVKPKIDYVRGLTQAQICGADALICATKELSYLYAQFRRQTTVPCPVYYIPYSVDPERWANAPARHEHPGEVWIGWLGADEHEKDLRFILPVVQEVLQKYRNVRFFWKRGNLPELDRLIMQYPERCVRFGKWVDREDYVEYCARSSFDIMLAPLVSTPFNDCRSPMKWIEAAMLKTPCVCSRIWGYSEVIRNRHTGYLCARPKNWFQALEELIGSPALRQEMGEAAYQSAMQTHNLQRNAKMYEEAFKQVIARGYQR